MSWRSVDVSTEDGRWAVVHFERRRDGFWSVDISDEVISTAPEAICAVLTLALMQMKDEAQTP